ncbi:hypothetical protein C7446_0558 [Kushneria sinocarnis]|uniref:4-vinyl reductase 4VR domain-containing protein n=1 Tax=Kushneria sinocarnis TaxID=595502 RepID=A0A420WZ71_9GAMM|nr:DUF5943 domain-containing protein [Kushneria sinocarnis]RKR06577.1 hypothetical protein C7446_0558 [Kushneria sinocarnis]
MTLTAPELPISVDSETGIWTTDALPMLYVPRHFFINNHVAVEEALGVETYARVLYDAGYKSAWHWCEKEAEQHGIEGVAVFEHYMHRLSQRGWGRFITEEIDLEHGIARVRLEHSCFVYQLGKVERRVEYMFTGWFAGAMDQILAARGSPLRTIAEQTQSAAETGCEVGYFEVMPKAAPA